MLNGAKTQGDVRIMFCTKCGKEITPKEGCCVFCSYGTVKCPSKQQSTPEAPQKFNGQNILYSNSNSVHKSRLPTSRNQQTMLCWAIMATCHFAQLRRSAQSQPRHPASAPNKRRPCFILQTSTVRQDVADAGFVELVGVNPKPVVKRRAQWIEHGASVPAMKSPFGDGNAAKKSVDILKKAGYC